MLDLLFIFTSIVFFVVAALYIYGCDWIVRDEKVVTVEERVETSREKAAAQS